MYPAGCSATVAIKQQKIARVKKIAFFMDIGVKRKDQGMMH